MQYLRVFFSIIAVFCFIKFVHNAAVHSQEFHDQLDLLNSNVNSESTIRIERAAENNSSDKNSKNICDQNQPCGWAIYIPFRRVVQSFISNTCVCSDKKFKCIRTDDDLSVSAYVYHCRQNIAATDIIAPEEIDENK